MSIFGKNLYSWDQKNEQDEHCQEEYMWIDQYDDEKCLGICKNGNSCNNKKINGNFCNIHKTQKVAYLTS